MTQPQRTRQSGSAVVAGSVTSAISRIMARLDSPQSRAALARLRQGANRAPGTVPEIWEYTLDLPEDQSTFPSTDPAAAGSGASAAEIAVQSALGLWATHQQSKSTPMHRAGVAFGAAVRRLEQRRGGGEGGTSPVLRRFSALVRASSVAGVLVHGRGLVGQLRDEDLAFDYARFAVDLYRFQHPDARGRVRLNWGRAFQQTTSDSLEASETTETDDAAASNDTISEEIQSA